MAGTPEEDLLAWLDREEERLGLTGIETALSDIGKARQMFYDELGYDITDNQFLGLTSALQTRYEDLPAIGVTYHRYEHAWGFQPVYRDITTGRFLSSEDIMAALGFVSGY